MKQMRIHTTIYWPDLGRKGYKQCLSMVKKISDHSILGIYKRLKTVSKLLEK